MSSRTHRALAHKNAVAPAPSESEYRLGDLDEVASIAHLVGNIRNQDDYEHDIEAQAGQALKVAGDQRDRQRIEKLQAKKTKLQKQRETVRSTRGSSFNRIQTESARLDSELEQVEEEIANFNRLIENRQHGTGDDPPAGGAEKLPNESRREFLLRTGKITPFASASASSPSGILEDAAGAAVAHVKTKDQDEATVPAPNSDAGLRPPASRDGGQLEDGSEATPSTVESEVSSRYRKRRKAPTPDSDDEFRPPSAHSSSPGEGRSQEETDSSVLSSTPRASKRRRRTKGQTQTADGDTVEDFSGVDDGNEAVYRERLARWEKKRAEDRHRHLEHPDHDMVGGLKIPGTIFSSLFNWQKTGVQWLAELYLKSTGGILGDEMGLGKTIQVISFVASLHHSQQLTKPVIIVAPATLLKQWVNEFHTWWPPLRVSILHASGSGMLNVRREETLEDESSWNKATRKPSQAAQRIVDRVVKHGHVLVTTYAGLKANEQLLLPVSWQYAVLDEGHKIRNPNAALTLSCKGLRTRNRLILSGTPMQNNLQELWSLFDFVSPMRLGTLFDFRNNFEMAINRGGYKNASYVEVRTSEKCASTLKDVISPYLLRRLKSDVSAELPRKTEQVLFCKLTKAQSDAYMRYLTSETVDLILGGKMQQMVGIDHLRKICNHPDLVIKDGLWNDPSYQMGRVSKSGKMAVTRHLLRTWKANGHKALLFSQGRQTLNILEAMVKKERGMGYLRMDGQTPVDVRQRLVDSFNRDPSLDVFLLTTRVGGLGVNLTGANRVIIFDPDWNPANDVQARERAWRLGQKRDVTIYRLCTAGTIEEKIYQRQIFKQALANRVLKDPKQRGVVFAQHELRDLFSLGSYEDGTTETAELLRNSPGNVFVEPTARRSVVAPGSDSYLVAAPADKIAAGGATGYADPASTLATNGQNDGRGERDDKGRIQNFAGVAALDDYRVRDDDGPSTEDRIVHDILSDKVHARMSTDDVNETPYSEGQRVLMDHRASILAADATASIVAPPPSNTTFDYFDATASLGGNDARRARAGPSSGGIVGRLAENRGLHGAGGGN